MSAPDHRIEYLPVDTIDSAERNPKGHDTEALKRSMRRFGFTTPGLLDERTNRLVVGHGRRDALLDMRADGEEPPAGVRVDADDSWLVPVVRGWSSKDDTEAEAYLVADNRHSELGHWDTSLLADILTGLDEDLALTAGYTGDDIEQIVARASADLPEGFEFPAYDETAAAKVRILTCPSCGAEVPA